MVDIFDLEFVYRGDIADKGQIDFYDLSQALVGSERIISLTTHLLINGEIITQSPSLRGAKNIRDASRRR